jgi:hypothetical protein
VGAGSITNQLTNAAFAVSGSAVTGGTGGYTYAWTLVGKPPGSTKTNGDITGASLIDFTSFTPDLGGFYTFMLEVTDSDGAVCSDSTTVTVGEDGWLKQDLSTWTLVAGDVADLVVSTSSTQIVIADKAANLDPADWSYYRGPALSADMRYEARWERTNPGALDKVGVCVGARDSADSNPRFCGGQYESPTDKTHFGVDSSTYWTANVDCVQNIVTFLTDHSSRITGGSSVALDASGDQSGLRAQAASEATTTPEWVAYVRHGAAGGGEVTLNYEFWIRTLPTV